MRFNSVDVLSRYTGYLQVFIAIGLIIRLVIILISSQTDDEINVGKQVKFTIIAGVVIVVVPSIIRLIYSYY